MDLTTRTAPQMDPRDSKKYYFTDTPQRSFLIAVARWLFKLVIELEVLGFEHFPREGAVILAAPT